MGAYESTLLYPGMCLFEGTALSVGRGTFAPFRRIAAPWLDVHAVIEAVGSEFAREQRVQLTPGVVTPTHAPYAGKPCASLDIEIADQHRVRPVALALALLAAVIRTHREHFAWAPYPTAANPTGANHFALLSGRHDLAAELEALSAAPTARDLARWTATGTWKGAVRDVLLYD